ncbi:HNH endonuclease [Candidatus Poribacteria bacterium]|nr:HNH endonuclease [Candidatus Poribacteria bacterium]
MVLLTDRDRELWKCFSDLMELEADISYPFLLEVYDDYNQGLLKKVDFIRILRLVESYIFRRAVCNISASVMNKMFAELMNEVDKNNYLESLNNAFLGMDTNKRYPTDTAFKEAFIHMDVYNFKKRNRRDYLLHKLENCERGKEPIIDFSGYTIEHIMPQNLSEAWKQELGEDFRRIHRRWLHRIGNLTLTLYNSEYGNLTFKKKRDMPKKGLSSSPLHLSQSFASTEQWNEGTIIARAEKLAEKAVKIWIYPAN